MLLTGVDAAAARKQGIDAQKAARRAQVLIVRHPAFEDLPPCHDGCGGGAGLGRVGARAYGSGF